MGAARRRFVIWLSIGPLPIRSLSFCVHESFDEANGTHQDEQIYDTITPSIEY